MIVKCAFCGKEFDGNTAARYCSDGCKRDARNERVSPQSQNMCLHCGKVFAAKKSDSKYCSIKCRSAASYERNKTPVPKSEKTCLQCGNTFIATRKTAEYCSAKCRRLHQYWSDPESAKQKTKEWKEANREQWKKMNDEHHDKIRYGGNREKCFERDGYKCVKCGSTKQLVPHHKDGSGQTDNPNHNLDNLETLCRKCHMALHDPNPHKPNKRKLICEHCGKEFELTPSRIENGRGKYCSMACRREAGK